jgi:hypothetical protein
MAVLQKIRQLTGWFGCALDQEGWPHYTETSEPRAANGRLTQKSPLLTHPALCARSTLDCSAPCGLSPLRSRLSRRRYEPQATKHFLGGVRCCAITPDDRLKVEANIGSWCLIPGPRPHIGISNLDRSDLLGHLDQNTKVFFTPSGGLPAAKHCSSRSTWQQVISKARHLAIQAYRIAEIGTAIGA